MDFKGKVYKHPNYIELEEEVYELKNITSAFKHYWSVGFHPLIGKDGILPVPDIYSDNAIGRVHIEQDPKDEKSYSSSKTAWLTWQNDSIEAVVIPTSNTFLIYCVADNRDCCLLAYLDNREINSHNILNCNTFRRNTKAKAERFYKAIKCTALDKIEHESLFTAKWLNKET